MSIQYDDYINEHVSSLIKAADWLRTRLGIHVDYNQLTRHDDSKWTREEYNAYDEYFYGDAKKKKEGRLNFDYAWLHHIHSNPHHWQYWVLINDDQEDGTVALDIPYKYVIEMICDWWTFSWRNGNLYEIFDWYEKHKDRMILSNTTRELVEEILNDIKTKLDEED